MQQQRLEAAFKFFDKDGNGVITSAEIKKVLKQSDNAFFDSDFEPVVAKIESDFKGGLKFDDFRQLIESIKPE